MAKRPPTKSNTPPPSPPPASGEDEGASSPPRPLRVFNLVFLLVLVSILVFLGASWFKALNRSKISLSYFEKQIAGLDAEGREIVDDKGQVWDITLAPAAMTLRATCV